MFFLKPFKFCPAVAAGFLFLVLPCLLLLPQSGGAAESPSIQPFSAEVTIVDGEQQRKENIYFAGNALRVEGEENGEKFINILRFDRKVLWAVEPKKKRYTENLLEASEGILVSRPDSSCSVVAEEKVNGFQCRKEVCRITLNKRTQSHTRWAAKDLGGLNIKYAEGKNTLQFDRIKIGKQDPALFEIPSGYQQSQ